MSLPSPTWRPGKRVVIVGGGPGGVSTALAFLKRGYDVRIFEKQPVCKALGGGVLLCVPVLAILRSYGMDVAELGSYTVTYFKNSKGQERTKLIFNPEIEKRMGIKGWHYGVLRASAYKQMLQLLPDGILQEGQEFKSYTERDDEAEVEFASGTKITADVVVGADGVRSGVSRQAFGDPGLFHVGIRVWLAWCESVPGDIKPNYGFVSHDWQRQASFFPMRHEGKPGFEWWIVEPAYEGKPFPEKPEEIKAYISDILKDWADPMPLFIEATDFKDHIFRWEIYNRPSMKKWSKGRVVCVGDAVHPVSPYAAYGMGMAIEDGYHLACSLDGVDLRDAHAVRAGFELYEKERVNYVNHNMEFARFLGRMFHGLPYPLAWVRDFIFDNTPFLKRYLAKGYLEEAEKETMKLQELFVSKGTVHLRE
jgi:2-polyprenyl-6-methoxyphenol hydroxylase-like FAD-dependent oxidoreductase